VIQAVEEFGSKLQLGGFSGVRQPPVLHQREVEI
jgi:hypothetical protein